MASLSNINTIFIINMINRNIPRNCCSSKCLEPLNDLELSVDSSGKPVIDWLSKQTNPWFALIIDQIFICLHYNHYNHDHYPHLSVPIELTPIVIMLWTEIIIDISTETIGLFEILTENVHKFYYLELYLLIRGNDHANHSKHGNANNGKIRLFSSKCFNFENVIIYPSIHRNLRCRQL